MRGFGLQRGALASTVAHDAHNVVVVGTSDASMAFAVRRLANVGGGIIVVDGAEVLAELPLPVAGLLSDAPLDEVVERSRALVAAARELGCTVEAPFQLLAFLALSVIPKLKLTDRGLVDVDRFELVPLAARVILANAHVVTMDDAGTRARPRLAADRGRPDRRPSAPATRRGRPRTSAAPSSRPGSSTPITTSTRRSRARGRRTPTSSRGCARSTRSGPGSTRRWSTPPRAPGSPSSRCRAARPSSTTTTSSRAGVSGLIEAEVRAARELGVRIVASRGSMDLGVSDGGLPPDKLVEEIDDVLADTERLAGLADGAVVQIAVAPCSPFSVTTRLMEESAALARRLGLVLHTHLAETVEEEAYCRELYGCSPVEYLERVGWLAGDVWCAHCVHLSPAEVERFAARGVGVAHCPTSNLRLGAGRRAGPRAARRRRPGRARRRRLGVERAQRPLLRGEAGAARRPRPRRRRRR